MPNIVIQGTTVPFPDSSASPNWAPAVIQFAELVAQALTLSVGTYDISPQSYNISSFNSVSNQPIPGLSFSPAVVRSARIRYAVYRTTSTSNAAEAGVVEIVYNANNPVNQKWEPTREYTENGQITFNITDDGQVQFSTTALSGINHSGLISFAAQALANS